MTTKYARIISVVLLLAATLLLAAQCGGVAPEQPASTATQKAAEKPAEPTKAPEPTHTPAPAKAEPTATVLAADENSGAVKAVEKKSINVESKEDVTAKRNNYGGEYHDVSTSDAVSFHPYMTTDTASSGYQAMVYTSGLLRNDEKTLEYIPNMAESYNISEDGLTFTFKLRHDIKWSDGQPLTAQDFKWTYDQIADPKHEFPYLSQLDFIKSYEALDDYTIQVKIKEVYAPALGQIDLVTPLPKHVWEKLDWSDPEKNPEINKPSVVSGPYKLVEWKRDQHVIFEANPDYWYKGRPNFDRYVIEIVPDQDVAYQKMKNSESDTADITPAKLDEARQLDNITIYEWWPATAVWSYIGLNMRQGFVTSDINVRHALSYAIDKDLLTDKVMKGQAKRMCSIYPDTSWVYNPNVECYKFDQDKAKAEFAKAGYTLKDGKMVGKDGQQLKLRLVYGPNTSKTRELIAVTTQDALKQIGIEVEIQALEWASYLDAISAKDPQWDMYIGAWQSPIEPHIMYTLWEEAGIPDLNAVAYINKKVEGLFKEGGQTYDPAVRKPKYQEIQKIIADESPYIFLYYSKAWSGQNKRIQGIIPSPLGIGWNGSDWYIQEKK